MLRRVRQEVRQDLAHSELIGLDDQAADGLLEADPAVRMLGSDLLDSLAHEGAEIDEGSLEEVEEVVIRDRRHIAEDGIILSIIAINKQTGMIEIPPEIIFRGVAFLEEERLLTESRHMLFDTINNATVEERGDWTVIKEKIRKDLRKFFYKQTAKRPFILPVILEI